MNEAEVNIRVAIAISFPAVSRPRPRRLIMIAPFANLRERSNYEQHCCERHVYIETRYNARDFVFIKYSYIG